jgi:hypothetical protein
MRRGYIGIIEAWTGAECRRMGGKSLDPSRSFNVYCMHLSGQSNRARTSAKQSWCVCISTSRLYPESHALLISLMHLSFSFLSIHAAVPRCRKSQRDGHHDYTPCDRQ